LCDVARSDALGFERELEPPLNVVIPAERALLGGVGIDHDLLEDAPLALSGTSRRRHGVGL
jgi:hypothetical protein